MNWAARATRAIDPLLILPLSEWQEIISRPNIGRLTKACLVVGIGMALVSAPPYRLDHTFFTETFPSISIIALLTILLFSVNSGNMHFIPFVIIGINIIYVISNIAAMFVNPELFRIVAMFYSIVYYFINSIVFTEKFAIKINFLVFFTILICSFNYWHNPDHVLTSRETADLASAVALSAGCLITQQLVLAVRTMSMQRLADARIRMAEIQAERQIAEERLAAHEQVARLNRISVLEAMSTSLAHEINQPISAAMNYAAAAQRWLDRPVPDVEEALHAVSGAVTEIDSVGQRVLTIRQLSSRQPSEFKPIDLLALVHAQVQLVRGAFERRGIALEVHCPKPTAVQAVPASSQDLGQVLINLLSNALEAFRDPVKDGRLRVDVEAPTPRWAEIRVGDNGAGIAAEHFDQVFQPFFTTKAKGTGLGLSICREIAERHAGSLSIEVSASGGTVAILRLAIDT